MKKILATTLALVMVLSLSVSAMANPITSVDAPSNTSTGEITVTVNEGVNTGVVYSVTVEWTDTTMEYQLEGEGTWNPSTHEYDNATDAGWVENNNTASVKVTNHSNADVTATIAADGNNILTYDIDNETFKLDAATEDSAYNTAPSETVTITATSEPTEVLQDAEQFIVTITAYEAPALESTATISSVDEWNTFVTAWNAGGVYADDVTVTIDATDINFNATKTVAPLGEGTPFTGTIEGNNTQFNDTAESVLGYLENATVKNIAFQRPMCAETNFFQSLVNVTLDNVHFTDANMAAACLFGDVSGITLRSVGIAGYSGCEFNAVFAQLDTEDIPTMVDCSFTQVYVHAGFVLAGTAKDTDWSTLDGVEAYNVTKI